MQYSQARRRQREEIQQVRYADAIKKAKVSFMTVA